MASRSLLIHFYASSKLGLWLIAAAFGCSDTAEPLRNTISESTTEESPHNTLPLATYANEIIPATTAAESPHAPILRLLSVQDNGESPNSSFVGEFIFINTLTVPITYYGYRVDSWSTPPPSGVIHPFYLVQVKDDNDPNWHSTSLSRCGTGAASMIVPPQHVGRFQAFVPSDAKSAKFGIRCSWEHPTGKQEESVVWSSDVLATAKPSGKEEGEQDAEPELPTAGF